MRTLAAIVLGFSLALFLMALMFHSGLAAFLAAFAIVIETLVLWTDWRLQTELGGELTVAVRLRR